jgi:hypothetical protein
MEGSHFQGLVNQMISKALAAPELAKEVPIITEGVCIWLKS